MAFGFFRRRQKMVIIIMVVLMVAFLVGMQGFSMFFSRAPGRRLLGTIKTGKIISRDVERAALDLEILSRYLGLGIRSPEFVVLHANAKEPTWAYAILLAEARASGVEVSSTEVDGYLEQIGLTVDSDRYNSLTKLLKTEYRMPTKRFRTLVGRWLMIKKTFEASVVSAPPSGPRLERLFRDLNEKIELRVVKVPAEKFVQTQPEPTSRQIDELFRQFRGVAAGTYGDENAFGFGYYQPDRVAVGYLQISKEVIARVTRVDKTEARRYYRRNRSDFVKKVPVRSAKQEDGKKDTKGARKKDAEKENEPVRYETVRMSLTEAMPQIMAKLIDAESQRQMDKLVGAVQKLTSDSGGGVYQGALARLTLAEPARRALAKKIERISIRNEPLRSAIDALAASAGLKAICYPWGRPVSKGKMLPADKNVTLQAKQITLAEALERIGRELKVGPIEWVMCRGFEGVLFPTAVGKSGVSMSPVSVGATGLMDEAALREHALLGRSFTSPVGGGRAVAPIAFSAEGLERKGNAAALISEGRAGPEMYVRSEDGKVAGRLLWRLSRVVAAHEPKELTESLSRQVMKDFNVRRAFTAKAKALAAEIDARAEKVGLDAAAKKAGLTSNVTGLFARRRRELWGIAASFPANDVPFMELPPMPAPQADCIRRYVHGKVFALVPRNVEPPYPAGPRMTAVIPVAALRAVFVVERIAYRPPVRIEYDDQRGMLAMMLMGIQRWDACRAWFSYENIIRRTGFQAKGP